VAESASQSWFWRRANRCGQRRDVDRLTDKTNRKDVNQVKLNKKKKNANQTTKKRLLKATTI
jgi:hypothetical protein